jgi:hypothetical protein
VETILLIAGVLANTIGVVLIFYYGLSPFLKQHDSGPVVLWTAEELSNLDSRMNKQKRRYFRRSRAGLLLCILGGVLQMVAILLR